MLAQPKPRALAKAEGLKHYSTGVPCKYGHLSPRRVTNGRCVACDAAGLRARKQDPVKGEQYREIGKAWYRTNKERKAAYHKVKYDANRENVIATSKAWYAANKERASVNNKAWRSANPGKILARVAKRRANKLKATPVWVDVDVLNAIYIKAKQITQETGAMHHVDHIVPLGGKTVCGLHVPWNLQILPAADNLKKSNRLEV